MPLCPFGPLARLLGPLARMVALFLELPRGHSRPLDRGARLVGVAAGAVGVGAAHGGDAGQSARRMA